jgi:hypothetical protein
LDSSSDFFKYWEFLDFVCGKESSVSGGNLCDLNNKYELLYWVDTKQGSGKVYGFHGIGVIGSRSRSNGDSLIL